jgi:ATP-dependent protease ClpP protease subunit
MSFDIQMSEMLNKSKAGNFVFAPVGNVCTIHIFDNLNMNSCAEMVGNIRQIINQLPQHNQINNTPTTIKDPYAIPDDTFVFDVSIDCFGGGWSIYMAIASLFATAKFKGAIVRTNNIGVAASAASMLAIQGTPGYRIMSENAYNTIHYGTATVTATRENELDIDTRNKNKERKKLFSIYEQYTKLTPKELERYKSVENSGKLYADQCLKKHLCDWILTSDGHFIGRNR